MHRSRAFTGLFTFLFIVAAVSAAAAQVDVSRTTTAITYPLDEQVQVQFRGTTRFPRMKGDAKIKRTARTGTEIELSVSKMPRPFELGAGYATYVLWAISPEGHVDNLGEIKRRGFFEFDSKIKVTTPLQTFALIITAEPHFLVRRPSQEIMLENLNPQARRGRTIQTMPAVQYFGNSSDYFRDARTPEIAEIDYSKTPSALLQARQAIALARFAGADRDAAEELSEAISLYENAEASWKAGRAEDVVDVTARRAISSAVKAENTSLVRRQAREERSEKTRIDAEIRQAENRVSDAESTIADLRAQLAEEVRNRELSERDGANYLGQIRELRDENGRLREELGRIRVEHDAVKNRLTEIENEKKAEDEKRMRDERMRGLQESEAGFMQALRQFGAVSKNERGIILTLPENVWSGPRASTFTPAADPKMTALAEFLANNPDYRIMVESHTDDSGAPEELQSLTEQRSNAVTERLVGFGIPNGRIEARGLGATLPIAPNTTARNRARNRRMHVILVPNI